MWSEFLHTMQYTQKSKVHHMSAEKKIEYIMNCGRYFLKLGVPLCYAFSKLVSQISLFSLLSSEILLQFFFLKYWKVFFNLSMAHDFFFLTVVNLNKFLNNNSLCKVSLPIGKILKKVLFLKEIILLQFNGENLFSQMATIFRAKIREYRFETI